MFGGRRLHAWATPRSVQAEHGIFFEQRSLRRVHSVQQYDGRFRLIPVEPLLEVAAGVIFQFIKSAGYWIS